MKYLNLFAVLFLMTGISQNGTAQKSNVEYKVSLSSGTLVIQDVDGLNIEEYNGTEILFSTMLEDQEKNDRSRGLRLVNSLGLEDNTGFGLSVIKEGNTVTASQISEQCSCNEIDIKVPKGVKLAISHASHDADEINITNFSSELEITTNYHNINLNNVTGPMAVKTVYGNIEGIFSSLSQEGSVSLYSVYELVDITLPANAKANTTISAPYGNVYSNFDIQVEKKPTQKQSCGSNQSIEGTINGGGLQFNIKSAYEDVYLRYK